MGDEGGLYFLEQLLDGLLEARLFRLCFLRHFGVFRVEGGPGVGGGRARMDYCWGYLSQGLVSVVGAARELLLVLLKSGVHFDQGLEMSVLPAQRSHALLVPYRLRIGELSLYLSGTLDGVRETIT